MPIDTPIGRNGWRQGSVLRQADHAKLDENIRSSLRLDASIVVVSHDCDVTNGSYEKEPTVELFVVYPRTEKKGGRTFGKSPREIDFQIRVDGCDTSFIGHASDRYHIDRRILETITPDPQSHLPSESVSLLRSWLAQRYNRSAFPDVFLNRLEQVKDNIESILNREGAEISAILIGIKPDDVDVREDESYEVNLYAVMPVNLYKQASLRTKAQLVIDQLGKLFRKCGGIQLVDAEVRSENEVTLDDMRYLKRFTTDYLSNKKSSSVFFPGT